MTSMYVRGFLMVIILLGAYVEFHTPGVGVPGLVALIALAIFVVAPYLAGLANIWEIVAVFVGLVLIALELFVIPGFGLVGISGALMVLVGLVATFVPDEPGRSFPLLFPSLPSTVEALKVAIITVVASMTASLLGMVMLSRYLPIMPVFRRLVPANPTPSGVSVEDGYRGAARVGDLGTAEGPLRPAGKARFADILVDVVTQGEFLESQSRIVVIERRGNRVVVRADNG
jgi:membrane-bound serine protease (ClpP class)